MIYDMSRVFFLHQIYWNKWYWSLFGFSQLCLMYRSKTVQVFLFSIYKLSVDSVHIHFVKLCLVHLFRVNIKSLFYFAVLKIYFQCYFHVSTRKSSRIHAKYICGQVNWCFFRQWLQSSSPKAIRYSFLHSSWSNWKRNE